MQSVKPVRERIIEGYLRRPENIAFSFDGGRNAFTSEETLSSAANIGSFLREHGVAEDCGVVGIIHNQSPMAYLTQLSLFLHGITYVIIDSDTVSERLNLIVSKLEINSLLVFEEHLRYREVDTNVLLIRESAFERTGDFDQSKVPPVSPSKIAYIVLTSGSTGEPKAVSISHLNLDYFVTWAIEIFDLDFGDVFATLNPPHFDNAVFDFFCSQSSGGTLAIIPIRALQQPISAAELLSVAGCTVWFSVPSLLIYFLKTRALTPSFLERFTKILFGGEGFPMKHLHDLWGIINKSVTRVWNVYGPSECACMCSAHEIRDEDIDANYDFAPIGEISKFFESELANQDSRGVGELVLYGPQVGPGYVGDENSSSNFLYRSADTRPEMRRGYKTGDLMRVDSQGLLRFSGRRDTQVKLMGHRVELAAIEAEILRIPGCWESFVSVIRTEHDSDVVHAWVATTRPPAEVKEFLTKTLPGYMIPRRIHCMSILPKNRNGKVDRLLLRQSVS